VSNMGHICLWPDIRCRIDWISSPIKFENLTFGATLNVLRLRYQEYPLGICLQGTLRESRRKIETTQLGNDKINSGVAVIIQKEAHRPAS
jgi:hypothetical protein